MVSDAPYPPPRLPYDCSSGWCQSGVNNHPRNHVTLPITSRSIQSQSGTLCGAATGRSRISTSLMHNWAEMRFMVRPEDGGPR
jgi:hypothetical protein